jgi:hypothetical protein
MTGKTPADEAMGVVAITFEDADKEGEGKGEDTVGLDITLPLSEAEDWAASHEHDLKDAQITVQPADETDAPSPSERSDDSPR